MASRFWVAGGTGNFNSTTNWSTLTGGASGASVPGAGDDAFFDGNSGSGTVTINVSSNVHSWDMTSSPSRTVAGSGALTIGGAGTLTTAAVWTVVTGVTWSATGAITFDNRSGGITVTTGGVALTTAASYGTGASNTGTTTFADNCNFGTVALTHQSGTLSVASGKSLTFGAYASAGAGNKTVAYNSATINCTAWAVGGSNNTQTGDSTCVLNVTPTANTTLTGGTLSYPGSVNITGTIVTISDANTWNNLGYVGTSSTGSGNQLVFSAAQTISLIFSVAGTAQRFRVLVHSGSTPTTQRTITCSAAFSFANVDFRGIASAGAAGTWTGSSMGNMGNNSGITFTSPVTRYFVGAASSNWTDSNVWSTSSGGSSGASMPLPQDTAVFDNNSVTADSTTITHDILYVPVLDTSGVTTHTAFIIRNLTANGFQYCGNVTLSANTTAVRKGLAADSCSFYNSAATITVTQNGGITNTALAGAGVCNIWSSVTCVGKTDFTGQRLTVNAGTFDISTGFSKCTVLSVASGATLTLGENEYTLDYTNAPANVTIFNPQAGSTVNGSSSARFIISNGANANKGTFGLGALTFGAIWVQATVGIIAFSGGGTATIFAANPGAVITNAAATQLTTGHVDMVGTSGSGISFKSATNGVATTISCASGIINCDWLTLQDCTGSGGATFFAGANSTNTSGNTGWSFTTGPARQQLASLGAG